VLRLSPYNVYDVIVYREGNVFYARDGRSGGILYSSSDSEALLQYVLNAVRDNGVVYIRDIVYADTLVSKKKVTLTGSGAIYTKTGKLVRLLGNIEVKDLEVDFYTPRILKKVFIEQFTDPNLSAWLKYVPSDGSVNVYNTTNVVSGLTFVERGVNLIGGSSEPTGLYKQFELAYTKIRVVLQVVDLDAATDAVFFGIGGPGSTRPFALSLSLRIDTNGNLKIVYVNTSNQTGVISTDISIRFVPTIIVLDIDNKNNYVRIYVNGKVINITDWVRDTNLKYIVLAVSAGYSAKYNLVYVEQMDDSSGNFVTSIGRPGVYHPVGVSDSLNVYALGIISNDGSTRVEVRDIDSDMLVRTVSLDETANYSDEHEYVYTRFVVEENKRYLYAMISRHISQYTIYKIDVDSWNIVWKNRSIDTGATYGKIVWGWNTGLAVVYRDSQMNLAVDHIDRNTGSVVKTDIIVSAGGGVRPYGFFSPDWSPDGYFWLSWSVYDGNVGLRRNVYALAIDKFGNVYDPYGRSITLPVDRMDNSLLIEQSDYSQPFIRPVKEGAVVFRGGFYTPDSPSAWWFRKPGQIIKLELPVFPLTGIASGVLIGRVPAVYELSFVGRTVNNVNYFTRSSIVSLPSAPLPPSSAYSSMGVFIPMRKSKIFVTYGNSVHIYNTNYQAHYDEEIVI